MEKLTIFIDTELKEKMSKYDLNWSDICTKAIEKELEALEQSKQNISDCFDIDIDIDLVKPTTWNTSELNPKVYKVLKKGWVETFGTDTLSPPPPSSKEVKKIWKIFQDDDNWDEDDFREKYSEFPDPKINPSAQWWLVYNCLNSEDDFYELDPTDWEFIEFFAKFVYDGKVLDEIVLLDPFKLSYIDIDYRDNLPSKSGIYFVIDDSKIYYIGMTRDLYRRWFNHHRQDDFDNIPNPLKISFLELPLQYLSQLELDFIKRFKPLLNIVGNR
jgi:hypothetical protein